MPFDNWQEAVQSLVSALAQATPRQQALGRFINAPLLPNTPQIVAAAILRRTLTRELGLPATEPLSEWHKSILEVLRQQSDPPADPTCADEADAWITYFRLLRRSEKLSELKVVAGDIVKTNAEEIAEVSSIGQDGRIFFKGGHGFGAWPDQIKIIARKNDSTPNAAKARTQAQNTASKHSTTAKWSSVRHTELADFCTTKSATESEILELDSIIASATDEKPIQEYLENHSHLLTALLGGRRRYCLSQKRLGSEYIPDFIIGDVDSRGIRWVPIELETPRSPIYLKDGNSLEDKARKGVNQVVTWRSWLLNNLAYARQRPTDSGLGLFDIRDKCDAYVFVGRRSLMPKTTDAIRHDYAQNSLIHIHTYDWLIERLLGAIRLQVPSASNSFLIPRIENHDPFDDFEFEE